MSARTDNFNRANSASTLGTPSDGGSAWVALSGTWGISSNAAYQPGGAGQAVAVLESSISDVRVQATFGGTISDAGLVCRVTDDANYILAVVKPTQLFIYRKQAGGFNPLAALSPTISPGDVMTLVANGSAISVLQNGMLVAGSNVTESFNQTATQHGIRSSGDTTVRIDDFGITPASNPAGVYFNRLLSKSNV